LKGEIPDGKPVSQIASELGRFYADMQLRFPVKDSSEEISMDASFSLTCKLCTETVCSSVKIDPRSVDYKSSHEFLKAVQGNDGYWVFVLADEDCEKKSFKEDKDIWSEHESMAYRPLTCPKCGTALGVKIQSTSKKDMELLDAMLLIVESLHARQGKTSEPLSKLVDKPKVMSMGGSGQRTFGSVGCGGAKDSPVSPPLVAEARFRDNGVEFV
jgi:hypothetical protein